MKQNNHIQGYKSVNLKKKKWKKLTVHRLRSIVFFKTQIIDQMLIFMNQNMYQHCQS